MTDAPVLGRGAVELVAGDQVGEYVIDGKIGEGGFGTVYKATHPLIGKVAAIKVLSRQFSADPDVVSRFVAEARAVNQIRNRHIVDIFAFGVLPDERHYFVMEFLDGESLGDRLANGGALSLADALPILDAVARALDAAHAKGIAHRDLKPDNVLLARDPDGDVFPKLLDFGIAKLLGASAEGAMHKTRTGAPIGTPYYMSPEQCRGRDLDHRTDIYSFGVMTYQVLTGVVPFDGDDFMDILVKQLNDEPTPPSTRVPALPLEIDAAVAWMMQKDPTARPPDLATAMQALADAARAAGIMTPIRTGTRTPPISNVAQVPRTGGAGTAMAATNLPAGSIRAPVPMLATAASLHATAGPSTTTGGTPSRKPLLLIVGALVLVSGVVVWMTMRRGASTPGDTIADRQLVPAGTSMMPMVPMDAGRPSTTAPPLEPAPTLVTITLDGAPAGAEVLGPGGTLIGVAPLLQLPRAAGQLVLTVRANGYLPTAVTVIPDADRTVQVEMPMRPVPKGNGGKGKGHGGKGKGHGDKGGRNGIDDPFATQ